MMDIMDGLSARTQLACPSCPSSIPVHGVHAVHFRQEAQSACREEPDNARPEMTVGSSLYQAGGFSPSNEDRLAGSRPFSNACKCSWSPTKLDRSLVTLAMASRCVRTASSNRPFAA